MPGNGDAPARVLGWQDLERDPYPLLAELRAAEPVSWLEPLGGWAVTSHALCEEVLRDPSRFETHKHGSKPHEIFGETMLSSDAETHRRYREPFEGPFRVRPVRQQYAAMIDAAIGDLLRDLAPAGEAELGAAFASLLPVDVIRSVLGLGVDRAAVRATYDDFAAALGDYKGDPDVDRRALATRATFDRLLRDEFVRMRGADDSSVVGDVIRADPAPLADEEIVRNALVVLFGGIETVESLVLNAMFALLTHPDAHARVRADPALVPAAIDETLRWAPPLGFLGRRAVADTELGGRVIRAGEFICAVVLAANRDPAVFDEPDAFQLGRANARRTLAFGHGPHFCLGFNLARLEAQAAVSALLTRLVDLRLDERQPTPELAGFAFRRVATLPVRWSATEPVVGES